MPLLPLEDPLPPEELLAVPDELPLPLPEPEPLEPPELEEPLGCEGDDELEHPGVTRHVITVRNPSAGKQNARIA